MDHRLWLTPLTIALLAAACGSGQPGPEESSTPTATPAIGSAVTSEAPPPAPANQPSPVSEEQLEVLLQDVSFPLRQWPKTNFRVHSVPLGEFQGGGPPKDGIPALSQPKFETVPEAGRWLNDREPVQVVEIKGDARAYPQQVMMWHELVNDTVGGEPITITF